MGRDVAAWVVFRFAAGVDLVIGLSDDGGLDVAGQQRLEDLLERVAVELGEEVERGHREQVLGPVAGVPDRAAVDLHHPQRAAVVGGALDVRDVHVVSDADRRRRVVALHVDEDAAAAQLQVADRHGAGDDGGTVLQQFDALHAHVGLVGDVADDLLQDVLQRDDAEHLAVLVDDHRDVLLAGAEGLQLRQQVRDFVRRVLGVEQHPIEARVREHFGDDVAGEARPDTDLGLAFFQRLLEFVHCQFHGSNPLCVMPAKAGIHSAR